MPRQFNNAGPSVAADHYLIDPIARVDLGWGCATVAAVAQAGIP